MGGAIARKEVLSEQLSPWITPLLVQTHIHEAAALALANYEEEHGYVLALPQIEAVPDLTPFADNGLGVAAFNGGKMVGFLCCCSPFDNDSH